MSARLVLRSTATFAGLTGATIALTWVYLSARAVMAVGGSCATGGPYEIATPCPHNVGLTMPVGIVGGLICLGVYLALGLDAGPQLTVLAWSALFLSLGWNFLDFGLHAPDGAGPVVGWLICAALFAVMGGAPVVWYATSVRRLRGLLWSDPGARPSPASGRRGIVAPAARDWPPPVTAPPPPPSPADDLATALRTMAALHDAGKLSDDEYAAAKRKLLED